MDIKSNLTLPFLLCTFSYGVGFTMLTHIPAIGVKGSSLFEVMTSIHPYAPLVWGAFALLAVMLHYLYSAYQTKGLDDLSGAIGFMVWLFGGICYAFAGVWLLIPALAIPNMWFWAIQYYQAT